MNFESPSMVNSEEKKVEVKDYKLPEVRADRDLYNDSKNSHDFQEKITDSKQSVETISLDPNSALKEYMAVPIPDKDNQFMVMIPRSLNITKAEERFQSAFDGIDIKGEEMYTTDKWEMVRPAIYAKDGDRWTLVSKGKIDLQK